MATTNNNGDKIKKRIVVCCDGTWISATDSAIHSNVFLLASAIPAKAKDGTTQIVFYQDGVGTQGGVIARLVGGATGAGLDHNVRQAYEFIVMNYNREARDEIFLFGFSRGAFTARSVAGLIEWAGVIAKEELVDFADLWIGYKEKGQNKDLGAERFSPLEQFGQRCHNVYISCLGVFDTVGSLGVPTVPPHFGHNWEIDTGHVKSGYQFHDVELGEHVDHAYQALALDEHRSSFFPAVWHQKVNMPQRKLDGKRDQVLQQTWFAGDHGDVGGGHENCTLSDISLQWLVGKLDAGDLLTVHRSWLEEKHAVNLDLALTTDPYVSRSGIFLFQQAIVRVPGFLELPTADRPVTNEFVHRSVLDRICRGKHDPAAHKGYLYNSGALKGLADTHGGNVALLERMEHHQDL